MERLRESRGIHATYSWDEGRICYETVVPMPEFGDMWMPGMVPGSRANFRSLIPSHYDGDSIAALLDACAGVLL